MKRHATAAAVAVGLALLAAPAANASHKKPWSHITRPPVPAPMPEVFHQGCPGQENEVAGCYFGLGDADSTGRVYSRGAVFVISKSRFAKLHELGHAFDETMMDAGERQEYARLRHKGDLLWTWSDVVANGALVQAIGTPAEDFADAYAACRMRRTPWGLWESGYGYYPTPRQHHRICRAITRAAEDPGQPVSPDGDR